MLQDIDVDVIKLDKMFFNNDENGKMPKKDRVIVESIVQMAHKLDCSVVCEGVETQTQLEFLKSINCRYVQGFIFEKPISIQDFHKKYIKKFTT